MYSKKKRLMSLQILFVSVCLLGIKEICVETIYPIFLKFLQSITVVLMLQVESATYCKDFHL